MTGARVVVGVDFGTKFSGFAYAHVGDMTLHNCFEWPGAGASGARPYCKTQTSLYYKYFDDGVYVLSAWGWPAYVMHTAAVMAAAKASRNRAAGPVADKFVTMFKLQLAGEVNLLNSGRQNAVIPLPRGLTVERVVTDFLREMKNHIMNVLQTTYGNHLTIDEVQWCLTVPAIWTEEAKQQMKVCAEKAGLVRGHHNREGDPGSPHPIEIVLEPEAAALACWKEPGDHLNLKVGEHVLVADVGGETVDIMVLEKVRPNDRRLKEMAPGSGGLHGRSCVDEAYVNMLQTKIPCLKEYLTTNSGGWWTIILRNWQDFKCTYAGEEISRMGVELPEGLTTEWKRYDRVRGLQKDNDEEYEEVQLDNSDLKSVFDPTVNAIMALIQERMSPKVKVLTLVGRFSASPYLMARMQAELGRKVCIVNPTNPDAAICRGAVEWGLHPGSRIFSRIAKKSYGIGVYKPLNENEHPRDKGVKDHAKKYMCHDLWDLYVAKLVNITLPDNQDQCRSALILDH